MVATSAFGMDINSNNILVVIHAEAPISISKYIVLSYFYLSNYSNLYICLAANLIQEAGCAEHNRNTAMHIIFFNENKPPVCNKCDNCIKRIANKLKLLDGKEEIMKLLEVIEFLTQEEQISPEDVVDIFKGGKMMKIKQKKWDTLPVYPTEKRKVLKTKELV
ncbi:hypothetical protein C1645_831336 [Glomus cerebriforme]|uniref:ATP-dependent DNA helicase RecQ zinc-binding domain-containing protein n=1 Tax=Glomus cerebriforme TaxID=658196 RepID=A0A397SLW1_9GLOM|nr:hypothetical protein C1645_831336 [Glomus cerebriforme]